MNISETEVLESRICHPGGGDQGQVFPIGGEFEQQLNGRLKFIMYFMGLIYCFIGVSIVADQFMSAIERVTSAKKNRRIAGTDRYVTSVVWNKTVANLTLMALGSSAPEILLSLNDIFKEGFFAGKLGASTIVGSAAFNLFVIIAVCINSIPAGEIRYIKEVGVYRITAVWSIFAYVWVLVIVQIHTDSVISVTEGVLTFLFFPVLVYMSYLEDVGKFTRENWSWLVFYLLSFIIGDQDEYEDWPWYFRMIDRVFVGIRSLCGLPPRCCIYICPCCCRRKRHEEADLESNDIIEKRHFDPEAMLLDENGQEIVNEAGILTFAVDAMSLESAEDDKEYAIKVYRCNGSTGKVSCKYRFEGLTATPGFDFEDEPGEIVFKYDETEAELIVKILPKGEAELDDRFQVILEEPSGDLQLNPNADGGPDCCTLTVNIVNCNPGNLKRPGVRFIRWIDYMFNINDVKLGNETYREQILEAFFVNGSKEAQDEASLGDWVMHIIWLPWKSMFACLTPPAVYAGGWLCFGMALLHIGWLTVLVGDLAELFGCVAGIDDEITAITFVALGTSVPDLFASRQAAMQDEYADASIVNVTGSNSVNVFLGIGLPWMVASMYWAIMGPTAEWDRRYGETDFPRGSFIVPSGNLSFSVGVFTLAALAALLVIHLRRQMIGGELGGEPGHKAYSSFFFFLLWIFYIALSVWKYGNSDVSFAGQATVVACTIPVITFLMLIFATLRQALLISKEYIGQEGFWGLFAAGFVIFGRMLVYFGFQYEW